MSKKALVIEDDGNIAELLRLYLERDGFDVQRAADGGFQFFASYKTVSMYIKKCYFKTSLFKLFQSMKHCMMLKCR